MYLVNVDQEGKSFLRRKDPSSGNLLTHWEYEGAINFFYVGGDDSLHWHCIGTYRQRRSAGFCVGESFVERVLQEAKLSS